MARRPPVPIDADVLTLSAAERGRLHSFARPADAGAFAAGRAILRRELAQRQSCAPGDVEVVDLPGRGPWITAAAGLTSSVAHGGDVVIVAVATGGAIGVDVEPVDTSMTPDEAAGIARDVLGAPEDEVQGILSGARPLRAFLERWTLTEAVLKAVGTGFGADPRDVRLAIGRGSARLVSAPGVADAAAARWQLRLLDVAPAHVVALAADASLLDVIVRAEPLPSGDGPLLT